MLYMVTFTINIPPMLVYIPYMDPMGIPMVIPDHSSGCQASGDFSHDRQA